nr:MAG TPA: hypothetical protein [Bacteriophage sp.]
MSRLLKKNSVIFVGNTEIICIFASGSNKC